MPSTKYEIRNGDQVLATLSKKDKALDQARATAKELKTTLSVFTSPAGNLVAEVKARKEQIKTTPYTRTVDLPEGAKIPDGARVCYTRMRKNAVILHFSELERGKQYQVRDFKSGKVLAKNLPTTRSAGRFLADEVVAPEKTPEPANA